ncbi:MAG: AgmX/PglI C-terminal domain-containing protein [Bdellovibrionota bacterium]
MKKQLALLGFVLLSPSFSLASEGLDSLEIQRVVRTNLNQVQHCYNQLQAVNSKAKGKIKVNFTIAPTGLVSKVGIAEDTIGDAKFGECLIGKIMRWRFPAPRGGKEFSTTYPFTLTPK